MGKKKQTRGNVPEFVSKIDQSVNKRGGKGTNAGECAWFCSQNWPKRKQTWGNGNKRTTYNGISLALRFSSEKAGRSDYKIMRCKSRIVNLKAIAHGQALIS